MDFISFKALHPYRICSSIGYKPMLYLYILHSLSTVRTLTESLASLFDPY